MLRFRNLSIFMSLIISLMIVACSEMDERDDPGPLVSTYWLQDNLDDPEEEYVEE